MEGRPIRFIDFFCYEAIRVIEVDGEVHDDSYHADRDTEREKILNGFGIKELRFRNEEVIHNVEGVLRKIEYELRRSY